MVAQPDLLAHARSLIQPPLDGNRIGWATNVLTVVELFRGRDHAIAKTLQKAIDNTVSGGRSASTAALIHAVEGIVKGLVRGLEAGVLPDLATRIRSDVEGDLLQQAQRLLDDGLKDPAAMLVGAVAGRLTSPAVQEARRARGQQY